MTVSASATTTKPPVLVRRLSATDAELVAPLFEQYRAFYGAAVDDEAGLAFLQDRLANGESFVFGAPGRTGSELVGFAQLYPTFSSITLRRVMILNDLFVLPGWRRRGVGRQLIAAAIQFARDGNVAFVELATQHTNDAARRLYDSFGFRADSEFVRLALSLPGERHRDIGS